MQDQNQTLMQQIFRVNQAMRQQTQLPSSLKNLSMTQLETLIFLKDNQSATMREVADHFHITMPSATSLITTLAYLKFIKRSGDTHDRRIVRLSLTKKGGEMLTAAMKEKKEKVSKILNFISEKDKAQMVDILSKILVQLEK